MRKSVTILFCMAFVSVAFSQKRNNGKVYDEHPAIELAEKTMQLFVTADPALGDYLADDFKAYNGLNPNKDAEGTSKANFLNQSAWWQKNFDYLRIERNDPAYPDAIEYKKGNTWVQTWEILYGVSKETGMKIDIPVHRLFMLNKEGTKVKVLINYFNTALFDKLWESYGPRTNGTIYKSHPYISVVRKMASAQENNDMEGVYAHFTDNARLYDINLPHGEYESVEASKEGWKAFRQSFDIQSIDEWGYPDYLEYEQNQSKVVLSWWKATVKRKADGKVIKLHIHNSHTFNDEGKITRSVAYYDAGKLEE